MVGIRSIPKHTCVGTAYHRELIYGIAGAVHFVSIFYVPIGKQALLGRTPLPSILDYDNRVPTSKVNGLLILR